MSLLELASTLMFIKENRTVKVGEPVQFIKNKFTICIMEAPFIGPERIHLSLVLT